MDKFAQREEGKLEEASWKGHVAVNWFLMCGKLFKELPADDGQHNCACQGGFTRWSESVSCRKTDKHTLLSLHRPCKVRKPKLGSPWILHKMPRERWKFPQTSSTPLDPCSVLLNVDSGLIQLSSSEALPTCDIYQWGHVWMGELREMNHCYQLLEIKIPCPWLIVDVLN